MWRIELKLKTTQGNLETWNYEILLRYAVGLELIKRQNILVNI